MKVLFLEYPKCSTCQKARKWLEDNQVAFEDRHIVEQHPNAEELDRWRQKSGLSLKSFFNSSGLKYKALDLKNKLPHMTDKEQLEILAADGMLVKRPLVVGTDFVLAGFKPDIWKNKLLSK